MKQAKCIDKETFIKRLEPYRVVFFGDHHNKKDLHKRFSKIIEDLANNERDISLANEWFIPQDNDALYRYITTSRTIDLTQETSWRGSHGRDFSSYKPVYETVKKYNGKLYGINISEVFRKKISRGNKNLFSVEQKNFFNSLDLDLYPHKMMLEPFFSHCHTNSTQSSETCKERMYRVQVAWDTYMAQQSAALAAKSLHKKNDLLIVFAGAMHMMYGLGINARFARLSNEPFVTILPAKQNISQAEVGVADFLIFYNEHH